MSRHRSHGERAIHFFGLHTCVDDALQRSWEAGVPVVVGTGAQNTARATALAKHAKGCGAAGLMVGVDTQVVHGFVHCGAKGAITGVGNALPREVLRLLELSLLAASGDETALRLANELDQALAVLSSFDEGPDLVLYYKRLMVLEGNAEYEYHINDSDGLSLEQQACVDSEWQRFRSWWDAWPGVH